MINVSKTWIYLMTKQARPNNSCRPSLKSIKSTNKKQLSNLPLTQMTLMPKRREWTWVVLTKGWKCTKR